MMSRVSDTAVAQAIRLAGRAEEIASQAEQDYACADPAYPSSPYPAAFAAVLRHLIEAGDAETLQVAVTEFDYREAQARRERGRGWTSMRSTAMLTAA